MTQDDMEKTEVFITKNGEKHCTCKLSKSGELLRLLEACFPAEKWSLEKIEKEGKE